jgi:hypothetical protein
MVKALGQLSILFPEVSPPLVNYTLRKEQLLSPPNKDKVRSW